MANLVKNEVIINTKLIKENINIIKKYIGNTEIIAVIKGNGYGHGLIESARICNEQNIKTFALGDIKEAVELRKKGFKQNMLLLFPPIKTNIEIISKLKLIPTVYKLEHLKLIEKIDKNIVFDLEINTGIGRSGCEIEEIDNIMKYIKEKGLKLNSAFTHLYNKADYATSLQQLKMFKDAMKDYSEVSLHIGGSYAFCYGKEFHLDGIRIGLGLYGLVDTFLIGEQLHPVMEYNTIFDDIITLKKGEHLGYMSGFTAKRKSKIGVLNMGYIQGYPKVDRGYVYFGNKFCKIVGGVNMQNMCVDVTDVENRFIENFEDEKVNIYSTKCEDKNYIMNLAEMNNIKPNLYVCGINDKYVNRKYI